MGGVVNSIWRLARYEFRLGWRSRGFWALTAGCALIVAGSSAQPGTPAALAADFVVRFSAAGLGFVAIFWLGGVACRDLNLNADDLLLSKPQSPAQWLLARFLGHYALLLSIVGWELGAAALAHRFYGGTPWRGIAYVEAWGATLVPLLFLGALGFTMSLLIGTPIAAGAPAVYWLSVLLGHPTLSPLFNPSLGQNRGIYGCLALGVLGLGLTLYRWRLRVRPAKRGVIMAGVLLALGLGRGYWQANRTHDPSVHTLPLFTAIAAQHLQKGKRAPGFWLPDQQGRLVGLHQFAGEVLVVGLWSPLIRESVPLLQDLALLQQEFREKGVTCIAVCIADDHTTARRFAHANRFDYPQLMDIGGHWAQPLRRGSPIAEAYDADWLPQVVITDQERRVRYLGRAGSGCYWEALRPEVIRLLTENQPVD